MRGNRAVVTAVVLLGILIVGWWLFGRRGAAQPVDLLASFESARKQPDASLFSIEEVSLAGDSKRAVVMAPTAGTRLTWKVRVPDDGWLRVWLGLKPEAWEAEGNGVLFFVGVSDGRAFDMLFTQHVNPRDNPPDRRWIPVFADLSAYGGEEVDIVFNTRASPENVEEDPRNDLALWGAPEVVVR
ncbi:MAG TPA: hypothetical protein VLD67_05675 [Vicinamibacterales bacterium]|nr:hypothetical protein [Vicinamibacterales bacterium]